MHFRGQKVEGELAGGGGILWRPPAQLVILDIFAMLLDVAHNHCNIDVTLAFRTDRNLFDLRKLQSEFKTTSALLRELLFADDCALAVHTLHETQTLLDQFVMASRRFGLSVSLKKTEVLFQPSPDNIYATLVVTLDNTALPVAETCYLCSRIHRTGPASPVVMCGKQAGQPETEIRVPTPPGKSWIFFLKIPGPGKS